MFLFSEDEINHLIETAASIAYDSIEPLDGTESRRRIQERKEKRLKVVIDVRKAILPIVTGHRITRANDLREDY